MIIVATTVFVLLLAAIALLVRAFLPTRPVWDAAWLASFQPDKYRPMLRLLGREDEDYLRARPGFQPAMLTELRRGRRRVFRAYLRELRLDFFRLHGALRILMTESEIDRPDLAHLLLQLPVHFAMARIRVEVMLWAHALGARDIEVSAVLEPVRRLQREILVLAQPLPNPA